MKKIAVLICIIAVYCATSLVCYGTTNIDDKGESRYVGTFVHSESFTKGSGATLIPKVYLTPKADDTFDKVIIKFQIVKLSTGTEHYNKSFTTYYNDTRSWFSATTNFTAPSRGTYQLNTTYKCYKNGKLIETIKGVARTATY